MPRNYVGNAASANFSAVIPIILDGEDWVDGTINQQILQPMLDRIAYLKLHSAIADGNNTFTGTNKFTGILSIEQGGHLNIDGNGAGTALLQIIDTGELSIDDTADIEIQAPIRMIGDQAILRKRPKLLGNNAFPSLAMGAGDVYINNEPIRTSNKTWNFIAPTSGVPCTCYVMYVGNVTNSPPGDVPTSFGGTPSDHDLHVTAGNCTVVFTASMAIAMAVIVYDGADFWAFGPFARS